MATIRKIGKIATLLPVVACAIISGVLYLFTAPLILLVMWLRAIGKAEDAELQEAHDAWFYAVSLPVMFASSAYNYIWQK